MLPDVFQCFEAIIWVECFKAEHKRILQVRTVPISITVLDVQKNRETRMRFKTVLSPRPCLKSRHAIHYPVTDSDGGLAWRVPVTCI